MVKRTAEIKVKSISLTLGADQRADKIKVNYNLVMVDLDLVKSCWQEFGLKFE
jgi:hypothetical protein